jgi:hypothetical protein
VSEYWVVDVQKAQVIAFKIIANRGSERLTESQVLPGLKVALLEEGLRRSRQTDNTELGNWFLEKVRGNPQSCDRLHSFFNSRLETRFLLVL